MKLMASGVTISAARVRSPSFSRSSSSTTTSMRPARISARAVATSVNGGVGLMVPSMLAESQPILSAQRCGVLSGRVEEAQPPIAERGHDSRGGNSHYPGPDDALSYSPAHCGKAVGGADADNRASDGMGGADGNPCQRGAKQSDS